MNIFISYSSKNRPAVKALVADLASLGHTLWFDQELAGGQVWWDTILANIRACDLFIFALTGHSLKSGPCKLEYTYAYELNKPILPVLLSDDVTISLLPVILQERQFVNYINQDKAALLALNNAIQGIQPAALPDPLPDPPAIPLSPLVELRNEIDRSDLTYEQQVALFHRIKGYAEVPDYRDAAITLMQEFEQHPALLAAVFKEINTYLSGVTPGRVPQAEFPADEQTPEEASEVSDGDPPAPAGTATLILRRPQEVYAMLRGYQVYIDGIKVGEVRSNSEVAFTVAPGTHTLHLQVDWVKGDAVTVQVAEGETRHFRVTGRMANFGLSMKLIIEPDPDFA